MYICECNMCLVYLPLDGTIQHRMSNIYLYTYELGLWMQAQLLLSIILIAFCMIDPADHGRSTGGRSAQHATQNTL